MGDVGKFLFGGSEQAGAPRVDVASTMTPEQRKLLDQVTAMMSGQLGKGVESYSGNLTAGPSATQTNVWDQINQMIAGGPQTDTSKAAIDKIMAGTNVHGAVNVKGYDVGEFDPTAIQNWYKDALVKPAMDTWENSIAPKVQEQFIAQNAGSSGAANRAIAGSASDVMKDLNAQLANALYGEKGNFDTRKFTAGMDTAGKQFTSDTDFVNRLFTGGQADLDRIQNIPNVENASMDNFFKSIGLGTQAGADQRGIEQQKLEEMFSKWQGSQGYNNPWLQMINTALGSQAFENIVQPEVQKSGLVSDLISPVMSGWGSSGFKTG